MKKENSAIHIIKKTWAFLKEDSWQSWLVSFILVVVFIKFIFFPGLSYLTGSNLPLVVVESCSMYHDSDFSQWWQSGAAEWYETHEIARSEFASFPYRNGLNKGDIIIVWNKGPPKLGDIIIFNPAGSSARNPIIHRLISTSPYATKGDNNSIQLTHSNNPQGIDETNIGQEQIIGKAAFRIPLLGWIKLIFFEPFRNPEERGTCSMQTARKVKTTLGTSNS